MVSEMTVGSFLGGAIWGTLLVTVLALAYSWKWERRLFYHLAHWTAGSAALLSFWLGVVQSPSAKPEEWGPWMLGAAIASGVWLYFGFRKEATPQ